MHIPDFKFHEPRTVAEACELLNKYCDVSKILAGGTDILVDLKQGRVTGIEHLISIKNIEGLGTIEETKSDIRIGALVTLNQAGGDKIIRKQLPAMTDAIESMAAVPVRNIATVVGNIAGAVPSSDLTPFLIVSGGEAVLSNGESDRRLKVEDYILGPRETACGDYEILTHLVIPKPPPRTGMSYKKFMLRKANALAVAGVAARLTLASGAKGAITESCITMTSVAPRPQIALEACEYLNGKQPSGKVFREAAIIAKKSAQPITDIRGTKEYRYELVEVLTRRALEEALTRARKKRA